MINGYTIYDTTDMYTKTPNRKHVRHHIDSSTGLSEIIF